MDNRLIIVLALFISGCSTTSGITEKYKYDADGNVLEKTVKTGGDIAAYQLSIEAKAQKAVILGAIAKLDKDAQKYMMIRGDLWTDEYASYIRGEIAEGEQIRSGVTGGIWGAVGLAGVITAGSVMKEGQKNGNNNTNVTNNNSRQVMNSDRSSASGDGNIGERSQLNADVDKAIGVPLDGDSNFDEVASGAQGGIIIDDKLDGSGNSAGLLR